MKYVGDNRRKDQSGSFFDKNVGENRRNDRSWPSLDWSFLEIFLSQLHSLNDLKLPVVILSRLQILFLKIQIIKVGIYFHRIANSL